MSAGLGPSEVDHSLDIEYLVLGQAVVFTDQAKLISRELNGAHFQKEIHRILFESIKRIVFQDRPCNAYFIWEEIREEKNDNKVDSSYILSLQHDTTCYLDLSCYIDFLKEKLANRKFSEALGGSIKELNQFFNKKTTKVIIEELQNSLIKIQNSYLPRADKSESIGDILFSEENETSLMKKISLRFNFKNETKRDFLEGLPTGIRFLDNNVSLLSPGNYVILAARPSVGKTAFSINLATYLSFHKKIPVGFFSLEMSKQQIAERILSNLSSISTESLRRGNFDYNDFERLEKIGEVLKSTPIYIIDSNFTNINSILDQAKRLKRDLNISVLFIDYIQLIKSSSPFENRQNEIAEISRQLKCLSSELQIPIVCLSQLSRKIEDRGNKRPLMSDLRDSGQIEQDADAILFLHKKDLSNEGNHIKPLIELILSKNRHGPVLSGFLHFDVMFGNFCEEDEKW